MTPPQRDHGERLTAATRAIGASRRRTARDAAPIPIADR